MVVKDLYCSDEHWATAKAQCSQRKWTILGLEWNADDMHYTKVLFDTIFDEIIAFNSMSCVSYVAVKKAKLWGLIRFRHAPHAENKELFEKVLVNEPIDKNAVDPIGREIKLIEDIKYPDIEYFKNKYHLDKSYATYSSIEDKDLREIPGIINKWSDKAIEITKDVLLDLRFGTATVRMKKLDGSFGFISLADATSHKFNVHDDESGDIYHYESIYEMIEDGWVVD